MEKIETLAIETYQNNVNYFTDKHPELMKKLATFDIALENGSYAPHYDLEYLKEYFDVKQLKTGHYLYSENSKEISKKLTKMTNFKKHSNTFEGFQIYNFSDEALANLDDKNQCLEGVYPLMNYYSQHASQSDQMKVIAKFIFIGVGLGLHIPLIHKKVQAKEYLVIEDDLELFRLSLFTTPYYELGGECELFFCIAEDENLFLQTMDLFLSNTFFNNRYLKYSYFPAHSDNKIKQIQNALATQSFTIFPYKTDLQKLLRPLEYINDGYNVLNLSTHFTNSIFSKKPVLLITAGPSLKKNLQWLKENHQRFILIAVSATLNTLYKYDITPDIVTHIDGFETSLAHYDALPAKDFLKHSIIVLGAFSPAKVRTMFSKEQIFYCEGSSNYFEGFGSITAPCIGSFSLLLSLMLDTHELYLLGLDLALDQETGHSHSDDHIYMQQKDMGKKETLSNTISLRGNLFPVQGNFQKNVYTTSGFHLSVQSLYLNIPRIKHDTQRIYNLNDGAKIHQAIAQNINDVNVDAYKTIDKRELLSTIHAELTMHSTKQLSPDDIASLRQYLVAAQKIKEYLTAYRDSVRHSHPDKYFSDLLELASTLLKQGRQGEAKSLVHIYYHFFKYVLPLAMDFFNTKELKNEKTHIKKIDKIIQSELFAIEEIYEKALKSFIEKRC